MQEFWTVQDWLFWVVMFPLTKLNKIENPPACQNIKTCTAGPKRPIFLGREGSLLYTVLYCTLLLSSIVVVCIKTNKFKWIWLFKYLLRLKKILSSCLELVLWSWTGHNSLSNIYFILMWKTSPNNWIYSSFSPKLHFTRLHLNTSWWRCNLPSPNSHFSGADFERLVIITEWHPPLTLVSPLFIQSGLCCPPAADS